MPVFEGLRLGGLGFSSDEFIQLVRLVCRSFYFQKNVSSKNGARIEYDTSVILEESQHIDVIILNLAKQDLFEPQLKGLSVPVVSLMWVEYCIEEEKYLDPFEFDLFKPRP